MLPGDIIGTVIANKITHNATARRQMSAFIMCYLTFPLIFAAIAVLGFLIVDALGGCTLWESTAITLSLLLGTSLLNYAQVHQENDLLLLTTLGFLYFGTQWAKTGASWSLLWATMFVGVSALIRLPAMLNAVAASAVLVVVMIKNMREENVEVADIIRQRLVQVLTISIPVLTVAVLIDRSYQVYRFGWASITTTYFTLQMRELLAQKSVPSNYPFGTPFAEGFFGVFAAPDASVFIYDPMLILAVIGAAFSWRQLSSMWKAMIVSFSLLLLCLAFMLARLSFWAGHTSWGDRYTTVPVEILAMTGFAICLLSSRKHPVLRLALLALVVFSIFIQASSLIFTVNLETRQTSGALRLPCVPIARAVNIKKALLHQALIPADDEKGREMTEVQLLPFRSSQKLPSASLKLMRFLWGIALVAWGFCLARLVYPTRVPEPFSV